MGAGFRLNSGGVQELLDGDVADDACRPYAEQVEGRAIANAPQDSGEYMASIHIEVDHTDRLVYRVVADAEHAMAVEARTGNLARALG